MQGMNLESETTCLSRTITTASPLSNITSPPEPDGLDLSLIDIILIIMGCQCKANIKFFSIEGDIK